jgi:hypothetical protein
MHFESRAKARPPAPRPTPRPAHTIHVAGTTALLVAVAHTTPAHSAASAQASTNTTTDGMATADAMTPCVPVKIESPASR